MIKRGKRILKKILAVVLTVALVLPILPQREVKAADPEDTSNAFYTYTYDSTTGGYQVGLTTNFVTALNKSDGSLEGADSPSTTYKWSASGDDGDGRTTASKKLPNPAPSGKYNNVSVTNMQSMFSDCISAPSLDLSNFDTSNVVDLAGMFVCCLALAELSFGDNFDTSNVTSMHEMFSGCSNLASLSLGNRFDTSNVTDMQGMFFACSNLTSLDLSSFDLGKIKSDGLASMFLYTCNNKSGIKGYAKDPATVAIFNTNAKTGIDTTKLSFQQSTFYKYEYDSITSGYKVSLSDDFKAVVNASSTPATYNKQGNTTWTTGDPLPAPATSYDDNGTYGKKNVTSMQGLFIVRRRITIGCNSKLKSRLTPIRPRGLACNCTFLSA